MICLGAYVLDGRVGGLVDRGWVGCGKRGGCGDGGRGRGKEKRGLGRVLEELLVDERVRGLWPTECMSYGSCLKCWSSGERKEKGVKLVMKKKMSFPNQRAVPARCRHPNYVSIACFFLCIHSLDRFALGKPRTPSFAPRVSRLHA